ncbi:MAG: zinc-ribbon domain-containing protein [Mariprofundaceae bacterium]|nr:zinc-ribbon domain-containing protein [Mariprofundaceae bacterium]
MEYIECTHCHKKYGVNDKIRAAAGRDIKCKACQKTFPIVLLGAEVLEEDLSVVREGGWDPSFTMPTTETQAKGGTAKSQTDTDDDEGDLAAFVKAEKQKKKLQIQVISGLAVFALLILTLFFILGGEPNLVTQVSNITQSAEKKAQQDAVKSSQLEDKDNAECREAAAAQWAIDSQIMHGDYSAEIYVELLQRSQLQSAQVRQLCRDTNIIQHILKSATEAYKPQWFEQELKALLP